MLKIRVAVVGVGNCASSLIQGLEFYRRHGNRDLGGLMHPSIDGYGCDDIEVIAAFGIDRRKMGLPVEQAKSRHYSTFSLYDPDVFEEALDAFREKVRHRFAGAVGNDTGPMHLIATAGVPSVVSFSHASDPELCAQRGPDLTILRRPRLEELSVDEVEAALRLR
jgi:hypothetical protein